LSFSLSRLGTHSFLPVLISLGCASIACAQSLEHRPTAKPATPAPAPVPAAPASQMPILPSGTRLQVEVLRHYPMKAGETIEARLMHPIYVGERVVVPENTPLRGRVVELKPDSKTRLHARLRGDFTPFRTARVHFDELMLPSGTLQISAATADDGAPVLQLQAPGISPKRSFISRRWTEAKQRLHEQVAYFTAPGKGDRALQLLHHQLPYHPQRIDAHTAWSFELTAAAELPTTPMIVSDPRAPAAAPRGKSEIWSVNATLTRGLTSAIAKPGDTVEAQVVEPVYDHDKQLVVPQGSTLVGKVSIATAAKSFGRNGKLRFTFQQIRFPEGYNRLVEGALAGAITEKTQDLSLDAEATITPHNKSSVIAPLLLTMLAGRALDEDGNLTLQTGVTESFLNRGSESGGYLNRS
jgi:type IV secretory pathway VirB10-like protein